MGPGHPATRGPATRSQGRPGNPIPGPAGGARSGARGAPFSQGAWTLRAGRAGCSWLLQVQGLGCPRDWLRAPVLSALLFRGLWTQPGPPPSPLVQVLSEPEGSPCRPHTMGCFDVFVCSEPPCFLAGGGTRESAFGGWNDYNFRDSLAAFNYFATLWSWLAAVRGWAARFIITLSGIRLSVY